MSITMPTITNGYTSVGCGDCSQSFLNSFIVDRCNNSSLSTSNNTSVLTNTGSKWVAPFRNGYVAVILSNTQNVVVRDSYLTRWQFENETYAYSGVNNTIIPSLSGKTCEYKGERYDFFYDSGGFGYFQNIGKWNTRLTNQNNIEDFEVIVYPKSNWVYTNGEITALTYSNGSITYSNPDYTF